MHNDIYLNPGDWYFGLRQERLHTLLGSCVAITLWHPIRHIGGMCHYLLPERFAEAKLSLTDSDGRYANEALGQLLHALTSAHSRANEYQVKMFGGGDMFAHQAGSNSIGQRNIQAGVRLLQQQGFQLSSTDLGGPGHRKLCFDLATGVVWVRYHPQTVPTPPISKGKAHGHKSDGGR